MKFRISVLATLGAFALAPQAGMASSVFGFLGNFDVINDTGSTAHGFEIELEGLHSSDITDTFGGAGRGFPSGRGFDPLTSVQRYGAPTISEYSDGAIFGTRVTYLGLFDGIGWDFGTPSGTFVTPGDNCWSGGGVGYGAGTPCDHFGVGTSKTPAKTKYSWLLETATPGTLTNGVVTLPAPAWNVAPAPVAGDPPVVEALIEAPQPEDEAKFGEAIWVKVFTTELENDVELEDLIGGNPVIDQALGETEIEWQLLQTDPGNPESGKLESGYGVPVGPDAASIVRRYEFYRYSGVYDPESNEADVGSDSHPNHPELEGYDPELPIELGTYLGAQNAAVNLNVAAIPEPETWALMLSGLGLIGGMARRRMR
jgi:hypothetical protein